MFFVSHFFCAFSFVRFQPYLHESRHLHALKRARGSGGRFVNTKAVEGKQDNESVDKKDDGPVSSDKNYNSNETNTRIESENLSPTA